MGLTSFLGRLFLAIIFIGAGVSKFQDPQQSVKFLQLRYPGFYNHLEQHTKQYFALPEQLKPAFINTNSGVIIQGVAGLEIGLALFVLMGQCWAGALLSLMTFSFIVVIHNPIIHGKNGEEKLQETIQALLNLGIAGSLLLVGCCKKNQVCVKAAPAKQSQTPQQQQQQQSKKGKKRD